MSRNAATPIEQAAYEVADAWRAIDPIHCKKCGLAHMSDAAIGSPCEHDWDADAGSVATAVARPVAEIQRRCEVYEAKLAALLALCPPTQDR